MIIRLGHLLALLLLTSVVAAHGGEQLDASSEDKPLNLDKLYWSLDTIPDDTIRKGLVKFFVEFENYEPPASHLDVKPEDIDKILKLCLLSRRARCDYNRLVRFDAEKATLVRQQLIKTYENLLPSMEWALEYAENRSDENRPDIDHRVPLAHGSMSGRYLRLAPRVIPKNAAEQVQKFMKLASKTIDEPPNGEQFKYMKFYVGLRDKADKLFNNYISDGAGNYTRK